MDPSQGSARIFEQKARFGSAHAIFPKARIEKFLPIRAFWGLYKIIFYSSKQTHMYPWVKFWPIRTGRNLAFAVQITSNMGLLLHCKCLHPECNQGCKFWVQQILFANYAIFSCNCCKYLHLWFYDGNDWCE